jgi:hypothetical protein
VRWSIIFIFLVSSKGWSGMVDDSERRDLNSQALASGTF